jgi:hypothetical protein
VLSRRATQMSRSPCPPGRVEAMYTLSPSGDWIGQPSMNRVFSSELLPAISSSFWACPHGEKSIASATPASGTTLTIATANDSPTRLSTLVLLPRRPSSGRRLTASHVRMVASFRLNLSSERLTLRRVTARVTTGRATWV